MQRAVQGNDFPPLNGRIKSTFWWRILSKGLPHRRQSRFEVPDQIVRVLDPDRKPHQGVTDAELGAHVRWDGAVGHQRRVLDQALDSAEALGQREQLAALEKAA